MPHDVAMSVTSDVVEPVLPLVAVAEQRTIGASRSTPLCVSGRLARRLSPDAGLDSGMLCDPRAAEAAALVGCRTVHAPVRSSLVVAGKYADAAHWKARAYLPGEGGRPSATLKVWGGASAPLGLAERVARAQVAPIAAYRAVPLLDAGAVGDAHYVMEPVIRGRHPRDMAERRAASVELIGSLADAYMASGVEDLPLSSVVGEDFEDRVVAVLGDDRTPWNPAWGDRTRTTDHVARLVSWNRTLPSALGHGDLVPANLIRDGAGCWWLTDWEQARVMPVAFDLGKLLLAAGDLGATGGAAAPSLRAYDGAGVRRYRWKHQIALGVCLLLSMSVARARRARRVGRQAAMASQTAQHVRWLSQLLDD